ncbi:class I SAM-dependent methyltransferase [Petrachloros mirabilis]
MCGHISSTVPGLDNEHFDVVVVNRVLHHFRFDLDRVTRIMQRYLRPGGTLVA